MLVIIGLLDCHLAMMQAWAWVNMLNDRIPEQGIEQAFSTTFSGDFPCEKCCAIIEIKAKEVEQRSDLPLPPTKDTERVLKLIGVITSFRSVKVFPPACSRIPLLASRLNAPDEFVVAVPSPPPRVV
jgi:hypothetical protein